MTDSIERRDQLGIDEVDEEAEGAGDSFRKLAVDSIGAVGPAAFAELDGDQATALGRVARVVGLGEGGVVRVPGAEEAVAALFDPVVEVGWSDLVGGGEQQRITADVEEVVVDADQIAAECGFPQAREQSLDIALRRGELYSDYG